MRTIAQAVLLITTLLVTSHALAEPLRLEERAWNGLSGLLAVARNSGAPVATPHKLEAKSLGANDALLIVHPERPLPVSELAAFLRRGGRLAIADDFGRGDLLLQTFGIGRSEPRPPSDATLLRGNVGLLLAKRASDHPLAHGVRAIATNHPAVLHHAALPAVFALSEQRGAVVLAGAVGDGRLVAISDSSVLINNMLELDDNRTFAGNLVRYLSEGRSGTLYIVDSDSELVGTLDYFDRDNPVRGVSDALARLAVQELPRAAVIALGIVLALCALFVAATSLPRPSAYARRAIEAPECAAGFAGRVRHHARRRGDFLAPLLTFKQELESRLVASLRLRGKPEHTELVRGLRERGLPSRSVDEARALLAALSELEAAASGTPARVGAGKFSALVASGRRILADLDATSPRT